MGREKIRQAEELRVREIELRRVSAALQAAGMDQELALKGAQAGLMAASEISENKSVFQLREWGKTFERAAGEGWLDHPKWGEFRSLIARAVGLSPLAAAQADKDWAMWAPVWHEKAEKEMIEFAQRKDVRHALPEELVERAIQARPNIAPEQAVAARTSCLGIQAVVVTEGTAGAGKSFTLEVIKEVYQAAPESSPGEGVGYDIVGTAFSWNAAKVLQESAKLDSAHALAGLLIQMRKAKEEGRSFFKRRTLVIVDEAGLVNTMSMRALLGFAAEAPYPVRVLLTGDSRQLNPVQAGNALEAIVEECGSSRLDIIRRQELDSHKLAVKHFCFGRAEQGLWTYWQQESLLMSANADQRREQVMRDYVRNVAAHPMDDCLVLALENVEVKKLNDQIRERLKSVGLLAGDEHDLEVNDGSGGGAYHAMFCVGDRVVFRKNLKNQSVCESRYEKIHEAGAIALLKGQRQQGAGMFSKMLASLAGGRAEPLGKEIRKGLFNRGNGIVMGIKKSPSGAGDRVLRVLLSGGGEVEVDTADLRDKSMESGTKGIAMHHNFATTIYASQGQTVQRVLMMDSPFMNRRLAYVGMSRHKISCNVYADEQDLSQRKKDRARRDLNFTWSPREKARASEVLSAKFFEQGDLWAEMALAWNKESNNPTVLQVKKQMLEKRGKSKEGTVTGRLRPGSGEGGDEADESMKEKPPRRPIPISYEGLLAEAALAGPKKKGFFQSWLGMAPEVEPSRGIKWTPEAKDLVLLPQWSQEPLAALSLEELKGVVWGENRFGAPRLFALDREGSRVSRWTMNGRLVAGRGEPPVLPNAPESPWMVVAGAREALICWSHFKEKWKASPERAPSVAVAFDEADLAALSEWIKPGSALHCAWSPRHPESLNWAKVTVDKLVGLGYRASLYPNPNPNPAPALRASGSKRLPSP